MRAPSHVAVFPAFAQAALRKRQEIPFTVWLLLRQWDTDENSGTGRLLWSTGIAVSVQTRDITRRHAERVLADGEGLFWDRHGEMLALHGALRVGSNLGIQPPIGRERFIEIDRLRSAAGIRAELSATIHRTDDRGRPVNRGVEAATTGLSPRTLRRYDARGRTETIAEPRVELTHIHDNERGRAFVRANRALGMYWGRRGAMLRMGNIRRPSHQSVGKRRKTQRLDRVLRERRPADFKASGLRPRAYFPAGPTGSGGAKEWVRRPNSLGKRTARDVRVPPPLEFSVIESVDAKGRRRWESAMEPTEP